MNTNLPANAQDVLRNEALSDDAGRHAAAMALPGALHGAFAVLPPVKIGEYEVREFCDADFETLQTLQNPLQGLMAAAFDNELRSVDESVKKAALDKLAVADASIIKSVSSGQHAWNVCLLMTSKPSEVDRLMEQGAKAFEREAKSKFGYLRLPAIIKLIEVIVDQMGKSWETRLEYEAAAAPDGEKKDQAGPP